MPINRKQKSILVALFLATAFVIHGPHSRNSKTLNTSATADDFTTGFSALALVDPPNDSLSAVYRVSVQGVVVGTATVSLESKNDLYPKNFELKIVNRVGVSPVLSTFTFETKTEKKKFFLKTRSQAQNQTSELYNRVVSWSTSGDYLKQDKSDAFKVAQTKDVRLGKAEEILWSRATNLVFYQTQEGSSAQLAFLPFTEQLRTVTELNAKFDGDGFLNSALIPWTSGATLEFKRLSIEELVTVKHQLAKGIVDLAWFSDTQGLQTDFQNLRTQSNKCITSTRELEEQINRKLPETPYLLHRKIYNLGQACNEIANNLSVDLSGEKAKENALLTLGRSVRSLANEDKRELPISLAQTTDWNVLRDENKRWQWPRLLSHLIAQSATELEQAITIEETQKTALSIRVSVDKLGPRAVVKGILKPRNLTLKANIESTSDARMLATSLMNIPKLPTGRFDYINGQAFARGAFLDLEPVCTFFNGRVGIDLGSAFPEIFRSEVVHGVWDNDTRIQVASDFIRRAAATTDCHQVFIRTPRELEPAIQSIVQNFQSDVLQTETSFQFSNGGVRKLRLIPGTYDFVASSLVSGQVLGREELVVKSDKQGIVTLRFR